MNLKKNLGSVIFFPYNFGASNIISEVSPCRSMVYPVAIRWGGPTYPKNLQFWRVLHVYTSIYHPCIVNLRMVYGTMQITTLEIFKIFDAQFLEAKRYLDYLGRLRAFRRSTRRLAARAAVDGEVTCLLPALLSIWSTFGIWTANQHPITSTTTFSTLFHESYRIMRVPALVPLVSVVIPRPLDQRVFFIFFPTVRLVQSELQADVISYNTSIDVCLGMNEKGAGKVIKINHQ